MTILVDACVRDGSGGSPTAVEFDDGAATTDAERRLVPGRAGASHAAFVARSPQADGGISVRFFTAAGELRGCGHGTVAAQAVLLDAGGFTGRQHTGGRTFDVRAVRRPGGIDPRGRSRSRRRAHRVCWCRSSTATPSWPWRPTPTRSAPRPDG